MEIEKIIQTLNDKLCNSKIQKKHRVLLFSGILIALQNEIFKTTYQSYNDSQELANFLVENIINILENKEISQINLATLKNSYSFINTNKGLTENIDSFKDLITYIDKNINDFVKTSDEPYDIFGEFYIRYTSDDKDLGIVLTPKHITEFFCDIANITPQSVVFDNCCGTGGFLISVMYHMLKNNKDKESVIKSDQFIGIEYQENLFTLVVTNMILNSDGKINLFNNDCFNVEGIKKDFKPTIGLLNPPYKANKTDQEEWEFVLNNLKGLVEGGTCVALIPMSCVLNSSKQINTFKKEILNSHTLEAVLSLPNELFHNSKVGVVTCAVIITAHKPHPKGKETFFGYFKEDGFVKRKNKGRIDGGEWEKIKEKWLTTYQNRTIKAGLSVMQTVTAEDEWCAEAYMETDYSTLTEKDFIKTIKEYVVFRYLNDNNDGVYDE